MIINRDNFHLLQGVSLSKARCLYVCRDCGMLSAIKPGSSILEELDCECFGIMELLLVEIPDDQIKVKEKQKSNDGCKSGCYSETVSEGSEKSKG